MQGFFKRTAIIAVVLLIAAGTLFAEGTSEQQKGKVQIAYVEWARAVAITHVAAAILEDMGYDVTTDNVANAAMWQSVASGDSDALLCAWLPVTHSMFYGPDGRFTNDVVDLGANYTGAKLGLVVPSYVDVNSIPEAAKNADMFDDKITGIDPGAGMMQSTEEAIKNDTSGLGAFKLVEGSGPVMTAALSDAIDNNEPIIVTGWKPHWMFGRWDLKILDDPAGIYGKAEHIDTVVRKGLKDDMPEVYKFFNDFDWQSVDLGQVLVWDNEGMDPADAAKKFIDENKDLINSAMPDGMSL